MINEIHLGDAISVMKNWPNGFVHTCITSPPYYGLRDYGVDGQIGLEQTPDAYVQKIVEVFREVRRVLRDDGTLWLNLGDSYANQKSGDTYSGFNDRYFGRETDGGKQAKTVSGANVGKLDFGTLKPKDMIGIPWRVAFALQADGWHLRQDIIWHKPNPMPESVTDRCTKAHEYLFLLSKSERYYFDNEAIKEPANGWNGSEFHTGKTGEHQQGRSQKDRMKVPAGWDTGGGHHGAYHRQGRRPSAVKGSFQGKTEAMADTGQNAFRAVTETRNKRSVWTIPSRPYKEAHFATFPPDLIEPCILAGTSAAGHCPECGARWVRDVERKFVPQQDVSTIKSVRGNGKTKPMDASNTWQGFPRGHTNTVTKGWRPGCGCGVNYEPEPDIVLDPFMGSGTTAHTALRAGRHYIGCELNPEYLELAQKRLAQKFLI